MYEPLFVIPYTLFTTYASVYMLRLGVSETQIGLIASLGLAMQIFSSAISGHATDRLGRRRALITFDLISWSVGTLIWTVSQNFWFFLAAAAVNSLQRIPNTAWYCILVEDTEPRDRPAVFTALQWIGVASGLFAPVGGLLIHQLAFVPAVRAMYALAFAGMTAMFFLRNRALHETDIGRRKMREAARMDYRRTGRQYLALLRGIAADHRLALVFAVYILNNFQAVVSITYLSVYQVAGLHIPPAWIALFPAAASAAVLALMAAVLPRLRADRLLQNIAAGFAVSLAANALLIAAPPRDIPWLVACSILSAAGAVVAGPFLEALMANSLQDEERATQLSVLNVLILLFTSPAGIVGGWAYSADPRLPFALIAASFALGIALLWILARRAGRCREA